ncbi:augmenter of liver regeneration [Blakeslea trispora]|nr:augmenter of liver regeneration [Blakeslea trispora]
MTAQDKTTWQQENCPADAEQLGRAAWTLLHTAAAYYPDRPAPSQMDSMRAFITSIIDNYPCFGEEFKASIEQEPVRVGNRKKLSAWLCRQHNKVNEKLGKPSFDCSLVFDKWLQGVNKECEQ